MITRTALAGLLLSIALSACAGASSSANPDPSRGPAPSGDSSVPGGGVVGGAPGAGGGAGPIGGGPIGGGGGGGPVDPGQPSLVLPKPGQQNVHPVSIDKLSARVDGRHVVLNARWWSGVEPCSVLDSVGVARTGNDIVLTIREGADKLGVACIELAMLKATIVDLGELEPETYTISAGGDAPPIRVVVS